MGKGIHLLKNTMYELSHSSEEFTFQYIADTINVTKDLWKGNM